MCANMELKKTPPSGCELRSVIEFLSIEKLKSAEIYARLRNEYNIDHIMSLHGAQK